VSARTLPDADARARAASDFETNLVIVAGAGTGKTSLLVERVLNLVLSGSAELTQILAITFTEKAAEELAERLRGAVAARAGHLPLATSTLLVVAYPLVLAVLGFYLPAERKRLRRLIPAFR